MIISSKNIPETRDGISKIKAQLPIGSQGSNLHLCCEVDSGLAQKHGRYSKILHLTTINKGVVNHFVVKKHPCTYTQTHTHGEQVSESPGSLLLSQAGFCSLIYLFTNGCNKPHILLVLGRSKVRYYK